ncbi:hypothetical protein D3C87_1652310 [compost metagenome]
MGLRESPDARVEGLFGVLAIGGHGEGLPCDRGDCRKRILDAVAEFGDQQVALRLGVLAFGDVHADACEAER